MKQFSHLLVQNLSLLRRLVKWANTCRSSIIRGDGMMDSNSGLGSLGRIECMPRLMENIKEVESVLVIDNVLG